MTTDPQADGRTVVVRREYPDPVGEVWAALTEPDRLARWLGHYTGTGGVGARVEFTLTGEVDAGGEVADPVDVRILACDPPHRLVVEIPESDERSWHLDLTVEHHGDGAVLVFAQRLADGLRREDVEAGWRWYLDRLEAFLHGTPMPDWAAYT